MRIVNSIRNSSVGLVVHISIMILNFISRTYFVRLLGAEYLGINGLFTNIISMLNLAELGVGSAITYTLYKPLALDDKSKVATIMGVYKKIYYKIGTVVLGIGIALIPFLNLFINGRYDKNIVLIFLLFLIDTIISYFLGYKRTVVLGIGIALIPFLNLFINGRYDKNIVLIFLLFLIDTIISYFLGYKRTILEADQKIYILKLVNFVQQLASNILAIVILILTKNYVLYLLMRILVHILEDIFIIKIVENRYSYISYVTRTEFSLEEKKELSKNIKALFLHKIGGYFIFSTDNLIISKFISISTVGIFSNYTLIIESINGVIKQIINNISASYGNLIAKESHDKKFDIYNKIMFLNFWIGGVSAITLFCLINPFITLWIGNEYTFDVKIVIVMVINFYILSMRMSINIPRTTAGLFFNDRYVCLIEAAINIITSIILVNKVINFYILSMRMSINIPRTTAGLFFNDRYVCLIEAAINIITSIILVNKIGIIGVLLGTTITAISVQFITVPYLCYKHIFKRPLKEYYIRYFSYFMTTLVTAIITYFICSININSNSYIKFLYKVVVCVIVPNVIFLCRYIKLEEFKYSIITYFICSININSNSYIKFLYKVVVCVIVPNVIFLCRYIKLEEFKYYIQLLKVIWRKYKIINNISN